jgi:hypothetical protein
MQLVVELVKSLVEAIEGQSSLEKLHNKNLITLLTSIFIFPLWRRRIILLHSFQIQMWKYHLPNEADVDVDLFLVV